MTREVCEHFNPVDQPCAKCEEKRKSEALFLADELEIPLGTVIQSEVCRRAAKELRRLHAELERCKQVCAATSEAWREEAALGCDHCSQPLYAATKCRVCGRVTEPVQDTGVKLKPVFYAPRRLDDAEVEDIIKRNAAISECSNCASLKAQNTELDRKLAEMEAKLNNQNVDDAFRILAEANRRAIDYINHLEAENAKLRKGPV